MAVTVITAPTVYPVTLAEVKAHLRVDHSDEDSLITTYIAAATAYAEEFTGRSFCQRTLELTLDEFQDQIEIPRPPLQSVVTVKYDDAGGDQQTLVENTDYVVDTANQPGWVVAVDSTWPATIDRINAVRIRYIAGYDGDGNSPEAFLVPFDIKAAILLIIGSMYAVRESVVIGVTAATVPWSAEQLLRQHRVQLALA